MDGLLLKYDMMILISGNSSGFRIFPDFPDFFKIFSVLTIFLYKSFCVLLRYDMMILYLVFGFFLIFPEFFNNISTQNILSISHILF